NVDTLMVASISATQSLEDIARAASGPLWFQLYFYGRKNAQRLVHRAEVAGYRALVITVDAPRWGRKERAIRTSFSLPSQLVESNFSGEEDVEEYAAIT